jgi:two-component system, NarL family, nitrate/nitrite response regulator NarL
VGHGVRVVVADTQPLARAGLRSVLESAGMSVVGEVARTEDLLTMSRALAPDLCLVDASLPGDVVEAVRQIAARAGTTVVRADDDDQLMARLVRAGARGCLSKRSGASCLLRAILAVLDGEVAIPRHLMSSLLTDLQMAEDRRSANPELARLTGRERQVLDGLRRGAATSEIAADLFVAPVTVRTHVAAIIRKLNLPDRSALRRYAGDERPSLEVSRSSGQARHPLRAG